MNDPPTGGSHGKPHRTTKILSHARRSGGVAARGARAATGRPQCHIKSIGKLWQESHEPTQPLDKKLDAGTPLPRSNVHRRVMTTGALRFGPSKRWPKKSSLKNWTICLTMVSQ